MKKITLVVAFLIAMTSIINQTKAAFPVNMQSKSSSEKVEQNNLEQKSFKIEKKSAASAVPAAPAAAYGGKSQVVAAVLCILFGLGNFGVHDFYLGNKSKALVKLGIGGLGLALLIIGLLSVTATSSLPLLMIIGGLIWMTASIMTIIDFIRILIGNYPGL
jgi:TM2 domain-containing membrane protein YozV